MKILLLHKNMKQNIKKKKNTHTHTRRNTKLKSEKNGKTRKIERRVNILAMQKQNI